MTNRTPFRGSKQATVGLRKFVLGTLPKVAYIHYLLLQVVAGAFAFPAVEVLFLAMILHLIVLAVRVVESVERWRIPHLAPVTDRVHFVVVIFWARGVHQGRRGEINLLAVPKSGLLVHFISQLVFLKHSKFIGAVLHGNCGQEISLARRSV